MRSALALGWDGCFLAKGSVDPFNDKAVRAGQGACFSLPMAIGDWPGLSQSLFSTGTSSSTGPSPGFSLPPWLVFVADVRGEPLDDALLGVEKELTERHRYERAKQQRPHQTCHSQYAQMTLRTRGRPTPATSPAQAGSLLPSQLIPLVPLPLPRVALVLGNEMRGVSDEAESCLGSRSRPVRIPMTPHMESLNVGVAGAILMHTIRTQLSLISGKLNTQDITAQPPHT